MKRSLLKLIPYYSSSNIKNKSNFPFKYADDDHQAWALEEYSEFLKRIEKEKPFRKGYVDQDDIFYGSYRNNNDKSDD